MSQPSLVAVLQTWASNFTSNVSNTFSNLSLRDYIRIIWIVCGYLFLRPYLDKGFAKLQNRGAAKMESAERQESERAAAAASGKTTDESRDGQEQHAEESMTTATTKGPQWGKSARRRQEKYMEWLEKESERLQQEEEDKDIADLLEE
jgi:hypothetical protein